MSISDRSAATSATHLLAPPPGWQPICYAVLADGTLAMLAADVDLAGEHRRIAAAFQASRSLDPPSRLLELCTAGTAGIWIAASAGWIRGPSFPLETAFPKFDRFSDGRWLVVASRSGGEADARVLAPDGVVLNRLMLGDGIEHVAIDAEDRVWVAWFDEGVVGNNVWQVPGQERPPSSNGVACFAADGILLFLPVWPAEAGDIVDCYALNVVGPRAWACPYTEFPLVHFVPGEPARWWRTHNRGLKAVAVDGNHALLAGGYLKEANRLVLVELVGNGLGEQASVLATWTLPLRRLPPSDNEWAPVWHRPSLLTGRGATLHLIDDGVWYRWRVPNLVSS